MCIFISNIIFKDIFLDLGLYSAHPYVQLFANGVNGDLIFTKGGIRGPVVLDFSREITPLLSKFDEVPVLANLTKGMNE